MSVAELKERHIAAKATVNGLRERLKQRRQALLDTNVVGYANSHGKTAISLGATDLVCCRTMLGHTGKVVLNLGTLQNPYHYRISCLGLSSDGSALCTGSWDKSLKFRHLDSLSVIPAGCSIFLDLGLWRTQEGDSFVALVALVMEHHFGAQLGLLLCKYQLALVQWILWCLAP